MTRISLLMSAMLLAFQLHASPGAHGPNGEHLDQPASAAAASDNTPRFEAFTDGYELVGKLYDTELSVLVDEYKTNKPVLRASLELQVNDLKAKATFHEDAGDYAFDDANILEVLKRPGKYPLVFTLVTESGSDQISATLESNVEVAAHSHGHEENGYTHHDDETHGHLDELLHSPWMWVAISALILIGLWMAVRRRMSGRN